MQRCFELAKRGAGSVSPNPMVGAVLVGSRGTILASGYHRVFGGPHAEVECLRRSGRKGAGATLYVNLEPCSHHGKTPPCTEAIIRAGIRRVVVAMRDPNPRVAGRGIARLRRAGISVDVGLKADEARQLNRHFLRHITSRRPYVHVKIAQSADGNIARAGGKQSWISSPESRTLVHEWRATHDAVIVGAGTIRSDNPRLDVRRVKGRNPDVVILDGGMHVPPGARVFHDTSSRRVFLCTERTNDPRRLRTIRRLELAGVVVLTFPGMGKRLSLRTVLGELYRRDIGSVLVEGGSDVFTQFVSGGLADELTVITAPARRPGGLPAFRENPLRIRGAHRRALIRMQESGRDTILNVRWEG
jgi:diaminohydroxyphosphoribosylaminopyrimidine deaminase/5-amino-6-(5-phosphoribosylamino)uracil reductase